MIDPRPSQKRPPPFRYGRPGGVLATYLTRLPDNQLNALRSAAAMRRMRFDGDGGEDEVHAPYLIGLLAAGKREVEERQRTAADALSRQCRRL